MEFRKELSESALISAIEENRLELVELLSKHPKLEIDSSKEMHFSITDIPFPLFNSVFCPRFEEEGLETAILKTIALGTSKNVPILWELGPNAKPDDLGKILIRYGFKLTETFPGMAIDIQELNSKPQIPNNFKIKRVIDEKSLKIYLNLLVEVFKMPEYVTQAMSDFFLCVGFDEKFPLQQYIGYLKKEPVATSMILRGSRIAGVFDVVTLPKARCQGIGGAMTSFPLLYAKRMDYRVGVLTSSELGFKVYQKLGFKELCKIYQYVWYPQST